MNDLLLHDLLANQLKLERAVWARRTQKALQDLGIQEADPQAKLMTPDELKGHIEFLKFAGLSSMGLREMEEALSLRQECLYTDIMRDDDIMSYLRSQGNRLEVVVHHSSRPYYLNLSLNNRDKLRSTVSSVLEQFELAYMDGKFVLLDDGDEVVVRLNHRLIETEVDGVPDLALVIWMPDLLVPCYFSFKDWDSYGTKYVVIHGGVPTSFEEKDGVRHVTKVKFEFETDLGQGVELTLECDFPLEETYAEVTVSASLFLVAARELWSRSPQPTSVADLNLWLTFLKEVEKFPGHKAFARLTPAGYNWQSALAVALVESANRD